MGDHTWNLDGIDRRQQKRWVDRKNLPALHSVKNVAQKLWESIAKTGNQEIQDKVFKDFKMVVPEAPVQSWTETEFIEWWITLAKEHRDSAGSGHSPEPLSVTADVFVAPRVAATWASFRSLSLGGAPVRGRQALRIKVTLSEPAFPYLFWITPKAEVEPIYPWRPLYWDILAVKEEKVSALELPVKSAAGQPQAWTFNQIAGLETLLVLVNRNALTTTRRTSLKDLLVRLPKIPPGTQLEPGPVKYDLRGFVATGTRLDYRCVQITDQIANRHQTLSLRMAPHCDAGLCLSFRNDG